MKLTKCAKIGYVVSEAVLIALGVILVIWPTASMLTISYAIGSVILASGIIRVIGYFSKDLYSLAFQFDLALGIFTILFGIILLTHPRWIILSIPVLIGLFVLINGLFTLQTSIDARKFGMKYWWIMTVMAILSSVLGIVLILNPFNSAKILVVLIGITMIFTGAEKLFLSLYTIVTKKKNTK